MAFHHYVDVGVLKIMETNLLHRMSSSDIKIFRIRWILSTSLLKEIMPHQ